jgi:hypothetical protein
MKANIRSSSPFACAANHVEVSCSLFFYPQLQQYGLRMTLQNSKLHWKQGAV